MKASLLARHLKIIHPEHKDKHLYFSTDMFKAIQIQSSSLKILQCSLSITNKVIHWGKTCSSSCGKNRQNIF